MILLIVKQKYEPNVVRFRINQAGKEDGKRVRDIVKASRRAIGM
ncbi:MAG: hypothetical protein ACUVUR_01305 [bacterium]